MKNHIFTAALFTVMLLVTMASALANPVFTGEPATVAQIGQTYEYIATHTASDAGTLSHKVITSPAGMTWTYATEAIRWTPTESGTYQFSLKISDDNSFDIQSFEVLVPASKIVVEENDTKNDTNTNETVPASFNAGDILIGSDSQERGTIITTTWTVTNPGSEAITGISMTPSGVPSDINFTGNLPQTTLNAGTSMTVSFTAEFPLDMDSGRTNSGNVVLSGTSNGNALSQTFPVVTEAVNHLVIDEVEVDVDGNDDTLKSPGKVDEDAELGDEITITVTVENTFDKNMQIEDIELNTDSSDLDSADNLDDSIGDLDEGDDDELVVSFVIDYEDTNPGDAPFKIDLEVTGTDENGARHGETWEITLDMDTDSKDLRVYNIELDKTTYDCNDDRIKVDYEIKNAGSRDLDEAMVHFEIDDFDVSEWERDIEIDEGDTDSYTIYLDIPNDVEEGSYFLDVEAYSTRSSNDRTDTKTVSVDVECREGSTTTPPKPPTTGGEDDDEPTQTPVVTGIPVSSSTGSSDSIFGDAQTYTIILGVVVVVLLILVVALIARLAK